MQKWRWYALTVIGILQTLDYLSTRLILRAGGAEFNPAVRELGLLPSKLLVFALFGALLWITTNRRRAWFVCACYGVIVAWNLSVLIAHAL